MKNHKIFGQDLNIFISSFIFLLLTFLLYRGLLTYILIMQEIKYQKSKRSSNKERSTIMKNRKTGSRFEYIGRSSHFSFPYIPPLWRTEEGMISSRSITQRNSEMTKGTTWNNNCVSQRVIFATIKPANALLDGKYARQNSFLLALPCIPASSDSQPRYYGLHQTVCQILFPKH